MKKITRLNIVEHLFEYQLKMIGKDLRNMEEKEDWLRTLSTTKEKHEQFKAYAIPLLKKIFKFNTNRAKETFNWFDLMWGLRVEDDEISR